MVLKELFLLFFIILFDVYLCCINLNINDMKKSSIKIRSYSYIIKADRWLVTRLMTLFPWLAFVGSIDGLESSHFVVISVPAHVDSLVRPVIPKSCIHLRKEFTTCIDLYEEEIS